MFFSRSYFFIIIDNTINKRATAPVATATNAVSKFGQVITRKWNMGSGPHSSTQIFWEYAPPPTLPSHG